MEGPADWFEAEPEFFNIGTPTNEPGRSKRFTFLHEVCHYALQAESQKESASSAAGDELWKTTIPGEAFVSNDSCRVEIQKAA